MNVIKFLATISNYATILILVVLIMLVTTIVTAQAAALRLKLFVGDADLSYLTDEEKELLKDSQSAKKLLTLITDVVSFEELELQFIEELKLIGKKTSKAKYPLVDIDNFFIRFNNYGLISKDRNIVSKAIKSHRDRLIAEISESNKEIQDTIEKINVLNENLEPLIKKAQRNAFKTALNESLSKNPGILGIIFKVSSEPRKHTERAEALEKTSAEFRKKILNLISNEISVAEDVIKENLRRKNKLSTFMVEKEINSIINKEKKEA